MGQESRRFNGGCVFGLNSQEQKAKERKQAVRKLNGCMETLMTTAELKYGTVFAEQLRKTYRNKK